jgi:hypothetical protein
MNDWCVDAVFIYDLKALLLIRVTCKCDGRMHDMVTRFPICGQGLQGLSVCPSPIDAHRLLFASIAGAVFPCGKVVGEFSTTSRIEQIMHFLWFCFFLSPGITSEAANLRFSNERPMNSTLQNRHQMLAHRLHEHGRLCVSAPPRMSIIDATTLEVTGQVPLPAAADLMTFNGANDRAYVCNDVAGELWAKVWKIWLSTLKINACFRWLRRSMHWS